MRRRTKLLSLGLIIVGISVVKIIDKMSANDPIVKKAFVSISINSGLSLKRKVLVTTVLMIADGTFVFLEKKYPLIKLVKNKLYTIAYPIFIKVKACKSIFHRTSSTETVEFTTSSGVKVTFWGNSNETWLFEHPI